MIFKSLPPLIAPTVQRFTTSSGTYTTPAGVLYLRVRLIGGGGGGAGSGTADGTAATGGGTTTFGTSLLTATGGAIGTRGGLGGVGGTPTVSAPAVTLVAVSGSYGNTAAAEGASPVTQIAGPHGGNSFFGGGGAGGSNGSGAGKDAVANSGSGGGGGFAGTTSSVAAGSGGGTGAYIDSVISAPSATYAYGVGAGGNAGGAGTSGAAGGAGAAGVIIVEEFYQ